MSNFQMNDLVVLEMLVCSLELQQAEKKYLK